MRAETDLGLSSLAAKWRNRESQMSFRVKADLRLSVSQAMLLPLGRTGWTYNWFNKMLTDRAFFQGLLCDVHFPWIIPFTCHSNLLRYREISIS